MAQDLYSQFVGRLPYASEMLGIYRPMIGWNSQRKRNRLINSYVAGLPGTLRQVIPSFVPDVAIAWTDPGFAGDDVAAKPGSVRDRPQLRASSMFSSYLFNGIAEQLDTRFGPAGPERDEDWRAIDDELIADVLQGSVVDQWRGDLAKRQREIEEAHEAGLITDRGQALRQTQREFEQALEDESRLGGVLLALVQNEKFPTLNELFLDKKHSTSAAVVANQLRLIENRITDPFEQFDPAIGLPGVSVSPIGIVHLFRQYFFEFETFLGTPVSHVWLSPGSTVELIESSTRRTTVERTVSTDFESRTQTETSQKEQDELSEAVKSDNRSDSKLGFSTTATQSWGTGSVTATASLNLDSTQQLAREDIHKRIREQSEKISTDIRNRYQTTFKTVTETTDVSSKRYVLANTTHELINYELRRKMRRVGVQVQDIGTFLCWETFVDEPGAALGLSNLVHIAKPADLAPQPDQNEIPRPPDLDRPFTVTAQWGYDGAMLVGKEGPAVPGGPVVPPHFKLTTASANIQIEPGYRIAEQPGDWMYLGVRQIQGDQGQRWGFVGIVRNQQDIEIGVLPYDWGSPNPNAPSLRRTPSWDEPVGWTLAGQLKLVPTDDKLAEVALANQKITDAKEAAKRKEERDTKTAFYTAVQERVDQASTIRTRKFEDLREEERTVVYRALIRDLMAKNPESDKDNYDVADGEDDARLELRHVYSTVLNSIFDIDKMLYFVAPEWWKPRRHYSQYFGDSAISMGEAEVGWSDNEWRIDNYYITAKSEPARLGSSLGWILQLDGDDNRNRFLNAPWVRAVIPIRPGKEVAAMNWLKKAGVEGIDGLGDDYAEVSERAEITTGLDDAGIPHSDPPTIEDALRYLCLRVSEKHAESTEVSLYPDRPGIPDEDKVYSTPVDKVYEHGFYPLERSFRFDPREQPADTQTSKNFQCIAQWTEILPTDQVVPVSVVYDPKTGRQRD